MTLQLIISLITLLFAIFVNIIIPIRKRIQEYYRQIESDKYHTVKTVYDNGVWESKTFYDGKLIAETKCEGGIARRKVYKIKA